MLNFRRYKEVGFAQRVQIEGWFRKTELLDAATGRVKKVWHHGPGDGQRLALGGRNLITDAGMNAIGNGTTLDALTGASYLAVGTGNAEPTVADTQLVAELSRTISDGGVTAVIGEGPNNDYEYRILTRLFTEGQANGNLAELGFRTGPTPDAGTLFNRQLFRDDLGAPIVITKTSDEQLRITYEIRVYPQQVATQQVDLPINGVNTLVENRAMSIGSGWREMVSLLGTWRASGVEAFESNVMPSLTTEQTGTRADGSSGGAAAYVNGNFYREMTHKLEPDVANFASGIGSVQTWSLLSSFGNEDCHVISTFSPKIQKDNTQRVIIVGRYHFARRP